MRNKSCRQLTSKALLTSFDHVLVKADVLKSTDDELKAMWKRLDEKHGDPTKVVDVIMNAIQNSRNIRDSENNRLIELINVVEDGYRDLKRFGLEKELTTTSSMSAIEKKLPTDVKKEWAKFVSSDRSTVYKTDKFPSLCLLISGCKVLIKSVSNRGGGRLVSQ